jgi:hypothetical protein
LADAGLSRQGQHMIVRFLQRWAALVIEPRRLISLRYLPRFVADWIRYRRAAGAGAARIIDTFPMLSDRLATTPFDPHYLHQGAWLARRLADAKPELHVDIGSSVLAMSVLSGHVPTVFVDYRPLNTHHDDLFCVAGDIGRLPFADTSIASLSCLHVIEHIGLGRYGDPIDPDGARKAAKELQRAVQINGRLYLSTPIGRERVCFNAHRVFEPATIVSWFDQLRLMQFSFVSDDGRFHRDVSISHIPDLDYGCGFFEFQRLIR